MRAIQQGVVNGLAVVKPKPPARAEYLVKPLLESLNTGFQITHPPFAHLFVSHTPTSLHFIPTAVSSAITQRAHNQPLSPAAGSGTSPIDFGVRNIDTGRPHAQQRARVSDLNDQCLI
jgi:hypothetical protein